MKCHSKGFALVESLVAVLILLLGIVGSIGMLTRGITAVSDASGRAEVSIASDQLIGMMRNDQANIAGYAWAGVGTPPASYANWYNDLQTNHMPGIQVSVVISAFGPAGSQVDINFTWQRPGTDAQLRHAVTAFISPP